MEILLILLAIILIQLLPNDSRRISWRVWRPQALSIPKSMLRLFVAAAAAAFSLSAIMGLFLSLAPNLVQTVLHLSGAARSGEIVALLFAASFVAEVMLRHLATRTAISMGLAGMILGLMNIIVAQAITSIPLFLVGTLFAGIGQGLALTGVLAAINSASPLGERSEIISSVYVFNYLGLALPVLGIGALTGSLGLAASTLVFASFVVLVALFSLIAAWGVDPIRHPDSSAHRAMAGLRRSS